MTDYVLALDGGGTKTLVAIADRDGDVRLLPQAAGVNAMDNPRWAENLAAALRDAAGLPIVQATYGMPGFGESASIDALYAETLKGLSPWGYELLNDAFMAHGGAFLGQGGVLALSGTGTMAVAHGDHGYARAGGWGDGFGDEGSAYWIGREALMRASWVADGRLDAPGFLAGMMDGLGLAGQDPLQGLMGWYVSLEHPRSEMAGLAAMVDGLAEGGDAVARSIMLDAAEHIWRQASAAGRGAKLEFPLAWSHAGSVFKSRTFSNSMVERMGGEPQAPKLPPVGGGLWLAADKAGWAVDDNWVFRVGAALKN